MNNWILVFIGSLFYILEAVYAYSNFIKSQWYYMPLALVTAVCGASFWFWIAKHAPKDQLYSLACTWDFLLVSYFYFIPIMFFGIKLNKQGLVGLALMFLGVILLIFRGN